MRVDHITAANHALDAQADHCEQMAKAFDAEAEKMRSLAKLLRTTAAPEALPSDPKIEVKPNTVFALRRPAVAQNGTDLELSARSN